MAIDHHFPTRLENPGRTRGWMRPFRTVLLALLAMPALAAEPTFHERVTTLYSFSPHTLDSPAQTAKSAELDVFWKSVKAAGPAGLDELRAELARPDAPAYFEFDGASLLLSLSKSPDDHARALAAISRTDLRDIEYNGYFFTVHSLAAEQLDTSDAAFKILDDPKFKVYVVQHALWLDQELSLTYLLLPTKEEFYLEKAEKRLFAEKDVAAQKSLLSLIANTVTQSGDDTLARFAESPDQPEESRAYARKIIDMTKKMQSVPLLGMSLSSYEALKAEQRKLFALRVSDEGLDAWQHLRIKLRHRGYK